MCTLSIFYKSNNLIITMNRDEYRNRSEVNTIKHTTSQSIQTYYPVDKLSGGTWFGYNNQGSVLAILNRYHEANVKNPTSRGIIIPQLLKQPSFTKAYENLKELLLNNTFNPFDLIYADIFETHKLSWNGEKLIKIQLCHNNAFMLTSSSINKDDVLTKRYQYFKKFNENHLNPHKCQFNILNKLHLQQDTDDKSSSILMSRSETHSKSICQLILSKNKLEYYYFNEQDLIHLENTSQSRNSQSDMYLQCQHNELNIIL